MSRRPRRWIVVEGADKTPDGYRDVMLWEGSSLWAAFKAVRAGLGNGMAVVVRVYLPHR